MSLSTRNKRTQSKLNLEGLLRCSANDIPLTPISFLERAASVYRDRTSIVYDSVKYTWNQIMDRCARLASALTQLGISRGDVVAVLAPNVPAMYELHFGVPMAGAVLCTLNKLSHLSWFLSMKLPGGAMLPDTATIYVAGFGKGGTSIPFWENVHGFNMSCIGKKVVEDSAQLPIVNVVDSRDIITDAVVIQEF